MTLNVNALQLAETKRNVFHVTAPAGSDVLALLEPAQWVHVANKLRFGDRVEILEANGAWFAEVLVLEVGKAAGSGARVALLNNPVSPSNNATLKQPDVFEPKWNGPNSLWSVVRLADKREVKAGLATKDEAIAWIGEQVAA